MNLLHLLLALFAAAPVETWECKDFTESGWNNIIVVATIDEDRLMALASITTSRRRTTP
jgi:hypothetical protein